MSLLFGYLTLACFILLAVKYPLRIAGAHKANALLMKLHEAASGGFLLFALIHVFFTFKALAIHGVWLPVMGAAALLTGLVLIYACHMTKDIRKKCVGTAGIRLLCLCLSRCIWCCILYHLFI